MSRRGRARSGGAPKSSLRLPHGDPVPEKPSRRRASATGEPEVELGGRRGTYTAVGYRSARIAEREGRAPSRVGALAHERIDRLKLQYQSRDFIRNNGLYKGTIFRARSYIVGPGFKLTVRSKSARANRKIEKAWRAWWASPDAKGELSGPRLEAMLVDELLTCGDLGVIPVEGAKGDAIQLVEAEQIMGKEWLNQGIDRDKVGRPLRYWTSPYDKNGYPDHAHAVSHSPDTFFYVSAPERPSSGRAVPPSQASFPMLHRIDDVCNAEAIAWQLQARVSLIANRSSGAPLKSSKAVAKNKNRQDEDGDATANYFTELPYGLIFHGKPGETVTGMARTAPSSAFTEALTMFFRLLGLPLGLPLELILLDWSNANYSQSRAVLEQAYQTFAAWQDLLVDRFYNRVFFWWLNRRMADGTLPVRDDVTPDWIRPTFPWIDQLQEAQAHGEKMDRGFTTHAQVLKTLNQEREDVLEDLERETVEAIELAQRVEAKTGVKIPWESFAGKKPTPSGSPPAKGEDGAGDKDKKKDKKPGAEKDDSKKKDAARSRARARRPKASARGVTGRRQSVGA